MEIFAVFGLINGIVALIIGAFVFLKNRHSFENQLFTLFSVSIAVWSLSYWRWLSADILSDALFWIKFFTVGSIFIPPLYFHWIVRLLELEKLWRYLSYFFYFFSAIVLGSLALFPESVITAVGAKSFFLYWPEAGAIYATYIATYVASVLVSTIFLFNKYFTIADKTRKSQYLFLLWGSIIGFGGGATNFFLWYNIPIYPYGNFLVSVGLLFWGYAAARYSLFNAKIITTEFFTFILWIFIFTRFLLSETLRDWMITGITFTATVVFGIFLIRSVHGEVSARERTELLAKDLKKANERLKLLDEQKSEFVSIASHQLRSPLTAIKGYASLLLEGSYGKMSAKVAGPIHKILASSQSLVNVVEDFLNVARIEQGRMQYHLTPVDIKVLTRKIIDELKPNMDEKKLALVFKAGPGKENYVQADEGKIRQVILNVIDNAIKFTPKGNITISISRNNERHAVLFAIHDTGIGLPDEFKDELFGKFNRADNSNKVHANGSGIGLYLAREIVKAHQGRIWAQSEGEGKGTTFYIELPAV
ncbi:MAG: ATP-binding protein [Patescibacteria group bacterium]